MPSNLVIARINENSLSRQMLSEKTADRTSDSFRNLTEARSVWAKKKFEKKRVGHR